MKSNFDTCQSDPELTPMAGHRPFRPPKMNSVGAAYQKLWTEIAFKYLLIPSGGYSNGQTRLLPPISLSADGRISSSSLTKVVTACIARLVNEQQDKKLRLHVGVISAVREHYHQVSLLNISRFYGFNGVGVRPTKSGINCFYRNGAS